MNLNESFWDERYKTNNTGWDLGVVSPPLKSYIDQLERKDLSVLIPGGGNAHEAEYLFNNGFKQVYVVDLSRTALDNIQKRIPEFPSHQLIHNDFFNISGTFDLVLEQTFFCALDPNLRQAYADKMFELLKTHGKLVGLLFNVPLYENRPPFGGNKSEYLSYFEDRFQIEIMEPAHNSHESRMGKELFIKLVKNH